MNENEKSKSLNLEVKRVRVRTGIKGGRQDAETWPRVGTPWQTPPRHNDFE